MAWGQASPPRSATPNVWRSPAERSRSTQLGRDPRATPNRGQASARWCSWRRAAAAAWRRRVAEPFGTLCGTAGARPRTAWVNGFPGWGCQGCYARSLGTPWIKGFRGLLACFLFGCHQERDWVYIHCLRPHPPGHDLPNCFGCRQERDWVLACFLFGCHQERDWASGAPRIQTSSPVSRSIFTTASWFRSETIRFPSVGSRMTALPWLQSRVSPS